MSKLPPTKHPPKPRLTLRVGITGHRPNKLTATDEPRVAEHLREVMAAIEAGVAAIHAEHKAWYSAEAPTDSPPTKDCYRIRLVSGFAEGADQMAVEVAPATWRVEAILPFPRDEYRKDFEKSAADNTTDVTAKLDRSLARAQIVTELPPPHPGHRNLGYVAAGAYLLRQVDILIAVWDGLEPKPGGTGAIAKEARENDIPVIWISTLAGSAPQFIGAFRDDKPVRAETRWGVEAVRAALIPILGPPLPERKGQRRSPREGFEQYCREIWPAKYRMLQYDRLSRIIARKERRTPHVPDFGKAVEDFGSFVGNGPLEPLRPRIEEVLGERYVWMDTLAIYFSHRYRSTYVLIYLLAALAVIIALFGSFLAYDSVTWKLPLVLIELAVIVHILRLVRHGRRHYWHERWLDYRIVAESLRHERFLACVSEFGHSPRSGTTPEPWTVWYLRATFREVGLPAAQLNEEYQKAVLRATESRELAEQITYHKGNADAMKRIDHFLHGTGVWCFRLTFIVLSLFALFAIGALLSRRPEIHDFYQRNFKSLYFGGTFDKGLNWAKYAVVLAAAGLPAIGAALSGIRVQGEFEVAQELSERMEAGLKSLQEEYKTAVKRPAVLEETATLLIKAAHAMSEDLAAWRELYGRKRINPPA